jgi:putative two-component system response regulator
MEERPIVLLVDDEQNVLNALKRVFIDSDIEVLTASSPFEALEILAKTDGVSVIVSDNLMPGMSGIEFLQKAKLTTPDAVRIMLTGYADLEAVIDAINKGEVYKFITKPWDDNDFIDIVLNSINRHEVVKSLKKADEYALYSLAQTIELKDHYTKGHCDRVARYALALAERLGLDKTLREHIRQGSWLHDCGKIGVPEAILNYHGRLSTEQFEIIKNHPSWGADVAKLAHMPQAVINIILYHHEWYDGNGYPLGLKGEEIPIEARIVGAADMYDALTSDRPYRKGVSREEAIQIILLGKNSQLDPLVVDELVRMEEDE